MIYTADMGMKKIAGIKLDQQTGKLAAAFVIDAISNTLDTWHGLRYHDDAPAVALTGRQAERPAYTLRCRSCLVTRLLGAVARAADQSPDFSRRSRAVLL